MSTIRRGYRAGNFPQGKQFFEKNADGDVAKVVISAYWQ